MTSKDFKIKFGNTSNEIDVDTLISSLMFMSNIIQEVNKELDTDKKIEVKIKALEKGSFEVHIELVETILKSLFSAEGIAYTSSIITVVGGLFSFSKFLKGEKPKEVIHNKDESITVINKDGNTTIFQNSVVNIYNDNSQVRDYISKQFNALEKSEDVTSFEIIDSNNDVLTYVEQKDFSILSKKLISEVKKHEIETLANEKMQILRPSFSTDPNWDFIYKGIKIGAKMLDEKLIEQVDRGENFAKGDLMVVELEITKFYDPEFDAFMITKESYKILKFKEHIKSGKTGKLF